MSIFKRTDYAEIGKTAAADEFSQAFRKASSRKKQRLIKGAVEAFRAGHPENIQEALSESLAINSDVATAMLRQLSEGKDDKAAVIDIAFAKATERSKKTELTRVLRESVCFKQAEESFVAALLKCGADANAEQNGLAGYLLALAVYANQSQSIGDILFENGASVEGALRRADKNGYDRSKIRILEGYQAKAAAKQAAPDADTRELVLQVQEEVRVLAKKVDCVLSLIKASDADQPEETKPPVRLISRPANNL